MFVQGSIDTSYADEKICGRLVTTPYLRPARLDHSLGLLLQELIRTARFPSSMYSTIAIHRVERFRDWGSIGWDHTTLQITWPREAIRKERRRSGSYM